MKGDLLAVRRPGREVVAAVAGQAPDARPVEVHAHDPGSQPYEGDALSVGRKRGGRRGIGTSRELLETFARLLDPENLLDPVAGRTAGEQDPLRLCRRPLRLARRSGHRRHSEPDHDDDDGQHTKPGRGVPRTCGAGPHLASVALDAVAHRDRTLPAEPHSDGARDPCPRRHHVRAGQSFRRHGKADSTSFEGHVGSAGLGMIGCNETTARACPARSCSGGVRSGGRRDRRARCLKGRGREQCADNRTVGADHRHQAQCPGHRRGYTRRPRSHGASGRSQHDARPPARHASLSDHYFQHLEPWCHPLVSVVSADGRARPRGAG